MRSIVEFGRFDVSFADSKGRQQTSSTRDTDHVRRENGLKE
jgi:hypothetical protein